MPAISRERAIVYLVLVAVLLALGGKLLLGARDGEGAGSSDPPATLEIVAAESGVAAVETTPALLVHVAGAVRRPGLYRLLDGSRVDDAIREAGGPTRRAALDLVNLAALVADGQQIVVPRRVAGSPPVGSSGSLAAPSTPGPVHLNTATLEELDSLPGVGPVTAQRILDYRTDHGSFQTIEELDAVSGIGPARLEQLRELVAL